DARRIFSNASSLFILQLITYAISLAAVPYLVRVLGPSKYGLVILAQSVITYFIFLVDYGFDMWGTMRIAENQHDKKRLSEIFHNVMAAKLLLGFAGFVIILILIASVSKFREEWRLVLLTFGMIGGQILIPSWFYRGMERMKFIAFCLVAVKTGYLVLVLLMVKTEADYVFVPLANFIAYTLAGFYGIWTVYSGFGLSFKAPAFTGIKEGIREGFTYFAKSITDNFAKITNTVILGFIAGDAAVGFYGSAEKLMDAVRAMLSPVFQAIFPHSRKTAARSKQEWFGFIKKPEPLWLFLPLFFPPQSFFFRISA
ncbi:MAG: oligosaccharide flippase family protein, partial [Geovibrio sp.]|nr:oligosaccharide flippase family protein [Geovibrio sp.]